MSPANIIYTTDVYSCRPIYLSLSMCNKYDCMQWKLLFIHLLISRSIRNWLLYTSIGDTNPILKNIYIKSNLFIIITEGEREWEKGKEKILVAFLISGVCKIKISIFHPSRFCKHFIGIILSVYFVNHIRID